MKMCTDSKTQALFSHFGAQMGKNKCSKRDVQNKLNSNGKMGGRLPGGHETGGCTVA